MGPLDDSALPRLRAMGIGALLFTDRRLGATDPLLAFARRMGLPSARFVWRGLPVRDATLPCRWHYPREAARQIHAWLEGLTQNSGASLGAASPSRTETLLQA